MPTTNTEVRQFCNLAGFYRKFVHKYAHIAKPLTDLTGIPGKNIRVELKKKLRSIQSN